eukprot:scaffold9322_cov168-Amphora_coffeaeformis.AAC.13
MKTNKTDGKSDDHVVTYTDLRVATTNSVPIHLSPGKNSIFVSVIVGKCELIVVLGHCHQARSGKGNSNE